MIRKKYKHAKGIMQDSSSIMRRVSLGTCALVRVSYEIGGYMRRFPTTRFAVTLVSKRNNAFKLISTFDDLADYYARYRDDGFPNKFDAYHINNDRLLWLTNELMGEYQRIWGEVEIVLEPIADGVTKRRGPSRLCPSQRYARALARFTNTLEAAVANHQDGPAPA